MKATVRRSPANPGLMSARTRRSSGPHACQKFDNRIDGYTDFSFKPGAE
jgi:hypothetical protein